jgi:hypothetical protein
MFRTNTRRQKEIKELISRIQTKYKEVGNYQSHTEDSIKVHVVLTNGTIQVPHIAIVDTDFAFEKPELMAYIRESFIPVATRSRKQSKQPFWKKLLNFERLTEKVPVNMFSGNRA